MKIYVDAYLANNLGDDLFIDILAKNNPNIDFYVNYYGTSYKDFMENYSNLFSCRYPKIYKYLNRIHLYDYINDYKRISKEFDACIFLGGSIFREEYYWKDVYNNRNLMQEEFKRRNKPIYVLGANFGPHYTKEFKQCYYKFFSFCDYVCFRDKYSYDIFKSIKSVYYGHDIIFQKKFNDIEKNKKEVSYSLIDPKHKQEFSKYYDYYIENMTKSIVENLKRGYICNLLSFCEKEGDLHVCNEIKKRIPNKYKKSLYVYNYKGNIDFFIKKISESNVIYASRFHATILGLIANSIVIPVVYSDKTLNVLNDLNFSSEIFSISNLNELTKDGFLENYEKKWKFSLDINILRQHSKKHFECLKNMREI